MASKTTHLYLFFSSVATGAILSLILGFTPVIFGKLVLALSMNFLAIPLAIAGVLEFPLWVWYVIVLDWTGNLLILEGD